MAPFNTHFLIAEKLWPELDGPWQTYYGQFCFGCVAPDVDKLSSTLTQIDTHFFDLRLPDLISHPSRRALGLVYLHPLAGEYMHLFRAPLPEPDVSVATVGCLKGRLAGRFAREDSNLIAVPVPQG